MFPIDNDIYSIFVLNLLKLFLISAFNHEGTNSKQQESCKYISFKKAKLQSTVFYDMLRVNFPLVHFEIKCKYVHTSSKYLSIVLLKIISIVSWGPYFEVRQ